mgnify:CR=1 FL=1
MLIKHYIQVKKIIQKKMSKLVIEQFIKHIESLVFQVLKVIPIGIGFGMLTVIVMQVYEKISGKNIKRKTRYIFILIYLAMALYMTLFSRKIGSISKIDLIPFNTAGGVRYIILYAIANALAFIPLGTLLPFVWNRAKNVKVCVLMGFFMSLFIETMQLILCCGVVQTEDLIMNTLGTYIGYILYRAIKNKRA